MKLLTDQTAARLLRLLSQRSAPVTRLVRRAGGSGGVSSAHQWKIAAKWDAEAQSATVSVAPGIVAWGGGASATWSGNGADESNVGAIPAGESRVVIWYTTAAPRPFKYDPRWPDGADIPSCGSSDCDCHAATGDPNEYTADPGVVALLTPDAAAPDGTTDSRVLGVVEVSEDGRATVTQWQRDTIDARAIVGVDPSAADDPDEDDKDAAPPCGNPMNENGGGGVTENPLDEEEGEHGGSTAKNDDPTPTGGRENNPLDSPGDGGYTPTCKDDEGNENAY